jgi:hypothetical protein
MLYTVFVFHNAVELDALALGALELGALELGAAISSPPVPSSNRPKDP